MIRNSNTPMVCLAHLPDVVLQYEIWGSMHIQDVKVQLWVGSGVVSAWGKSLRVTMKSGGKKSNPPKIKVHWWIPLSDFMYFEENESKHWPFIIKVQTKPDCRTPQGVCIYFRYFLHRHRNEVQFGWPMFPLRSTKLAVCSRGLEYEKRQESPVTIPKNMVSM